MRHPILRKKIVKGNEYWYTGANGGKTFGRTDQVTHDNAKKAFLKHLSNSAKPAPAPVTEEEHTVPTVLELFKQFINHMRNQNRSKANTRRKFAECKRFALYNYKDNIVGNMKSTDINELILAEYLSILRIKPNKEKPISAYKNERLIRNLSERSIHHAETSIRQAFNFGRANYQALKSHLPFQLMKKTSVTRKTLNEDDLLTTDDISALFFAATIDTDQFRKVGIEKFIEIFGKENLKKAKHNFCDLIKLYCNTGARTGELVNLKFDDFNKISQTLTLKDHKTAKSTGETRVIYLNEEAFAILCELCTRKRKGDWLFCRANGKPWNTDSADETFKTVKRICNALGTPIRKDITLYSFRHYWISSFIMQKIPIATVAKLAGNSVAVIERNYARFKSSHLLEATNKVKLY